MSVPEGPLTNRTGTLTVRTVVVVDRNDVLQMAAARPSAAILKRAFENSLCRSLVPLPSAGVRTRLLQHLCQLLLVVDAADHAGCTSS